jgi:hypothetical protein
MEASVIYFYVFFLYIILFDYCLCNNRLLEVRRHILLEIEVSERVSIRELEEFAELGVRKNNATILLVLKTVSADVGSHLLGDISSRHKSAVVLSEEISELIRNLGGLDETTWSAIALVLVLLCVELIKNLELLGDVLLNRAELCLYQCNRSRKVVKSLVHTNKQLRKRSVRYKRSDYILNRSLGDDRNGGRCFNDLRGRNFWHGLSSGLCLLWRLSSSGRHYTYL